VYEWLALRNLRCRLASCSGWLFAGKYGDALHNVCVFVVVPYQQQQQQ